MRLSKANVPGKQLTGLVADARRTDDEALNRLVGQSDERIAALESANRTQGPTVTDVVGFDIRRYTRSILDTDSAALRTVRAEDRLLSLEGAGGTLTLHAAPNFARMALLLITNNASAAWTIQVMAPASEQVYRFTVAANSFSLNPGDGVQMWNRTAARWELL